MPTKQEYKQIAVQENRERQQQCAVVGIQVMHALGQPDDLHRLQVCRLWEDHYRVNVFVGLEAGFAKVAHSFFLVVDGEGSILESTPRITKQY